MKRPVQLELSLSHSPPTITATDDAQTTNNSQVVEVAVWLVARKQVPLVPSPQQHKLTDSFGQRKYSVLQTQISAVYQQWLVSSVILIFFSGILTQRNDLIQM